MVSEMGGSHAFRADSLSCLFHSEGLLEGVTASKDDQLNCSQLLEWLELRNARSGAGCWSNESGTLSGIDSDSRPIKRLESSPRPSGRVF